MISKATSSLDTTTHFFFKLRWLIKTRTSKGLSLFILSFWQWFSFSRWRAVLSASNEVSCTAAEAFKYTLRKSKAVYQESLSSQRPRGLLSSPVSLMEEYRGQTALGNIFLTCFCFFDFQFMSVSVGSIKYLLQHKKETWNVPHIEQQVWMCSCLWSIVTSLIQNAFTVGKQNVLNPHRTLRCGGVYLWSQHSGSPGHEDFKLKAFSGYATRPCLKNNF